MAAGAVTLTIKDGGGTNRTVNMWSSDGTLGGVLTPLQTLVGADGLTIASATNGAPVTFATGATASISGALPAGANNVGQVDPGANNFVSGTATATGASSTSLIALVAAKRLYINSISVWNSSAATAVTINFQDGSGGTTLWSMIIPPGGGSNIAGFSPMLRTTAGNALYFQVSGSGATTVGVSASGYSGV